LGYKGELGRIVGIARTNPLVLRLLLSSGPFMWLVSVALGSIGFALFIRTEIDQRLTGMITSAQIEGNLTAARELAELRLELLDPGFWETVIEFTPLIGVIFNAKKYVIFLRRSAEIQLELIDDRVQAIINPVGGAYERALEATEAGESEDPFLPPDTLSVVFQKQIGSLRVQMRDAFFSGKLAAERGDEVTARQRVSVIDDAVKDLQAFLIEQADAVAASRTLEEIQGIVDDGLRKIDDIEKIIDALPETNVVQAFSDFRKEVETQSLKVKNSLSRLDKARALLDLDTLQLLHDDALSFFTDNIEAFREKNIRQDFDDWRQELFRTLGELKAEIEVLPTTDIKAELRAFESRLTSLPFAIRNAKSVGDEALTTDLIIEFTQIIRDFEGFLNLNSDGLTTAGLLTSANLALDAAKTELESGKALETPSETPTLPTGRLFRVTVATDPAGAKILVNGFPVKINNFTLRTTETFILEAGVYNITVEKTGFDTPPPVTIRLPPTS